LKNRWNNHARLLTGFLGCLVILLLAGCRHPCGYVGVYSVIIPGQGEVRTERTSASEVMRQTVPISDDNLRLEVVVEEQWVTFGPGRRETYGYRSYVPYKWYAPILKPVVAVTVVCPVIFSFRDPHAHDGGSWRFRDYGRDVVAWFNIASGVPTGPRRIETRERLIRTRRGEFPVAQRNEPVPDRTVILEMDGKELARAVGDDKGLVRFDLAPHLLPEVVRTGQLFQLELPSEDGTGQIFNFMLDKETAAAWIKAHPAP
jgi:hypothetical protein